MEKEEEPKFEFITSSKNKPQIILENKHIYNFFNKDKKDNQTFRCTYYKKANKCSSFIKIDKDKNIINILNIIIIKFQKKTLLKPKLNLK